uniref:Si:ch1073-416j23.1 n=1 Tax=Sinocyclocheilus grahami TaxID=75366 RepID=A0A672K355_SINGR
CTFAEVKLISILTQTLNNITILDKFIEVARNFEAAQKKWLHAELEQKKQKELLVKFDVARAALEVKLKHARNQLDSLLRILIVSLSKSSACLNDEQRSMLTIFPPFAMLFSILCLFIRLSGIDEASFLSHSDISYDRTGDDLEIETTVVKASVTTPETRGQIHMVIDITQETPEYQSRALRNEHFPSVIRPETCMPCVKMIRFGKLAIKCRDCRVVSHPECKQLCLERCSPNAHGSETLESFAPSTHPRIPSLIVQRVHEIERRGFEEKGIYRVPGGEQLVKELREKYVSGKGPLMLNKVEEVHAVCGLLKDFLRKLKEPLITFKLHRTFMETQMAYEDKSIETLIKTIKELLQPNKDTLAFLMLHLQRVTQSSMCQMDQNNLSRVFEPTVTGHGMLEPSPMTIMRDTNTQPKVSCKKISFISVSECVGTDKIFKPLTSPELSKYNKTTSSGSIKGRIEHFGGTFNNP